MNYTCVTHSLYELPPARDAARPRSGERLIELLPNQAVPVDAARGTVVRSLSGKLWLTQEGHWHDYTLLAGMSYISLDNGRIVVSAPDGASAASVYQIELAPGERSCDAVVNLGAGTIARIERDARRAQAAEIVHWIGYVAGALAAAWRRLMRSDKPAGHGTPCRAA